VHASVFEVSSFLQDEDPFELFDGGIEAGFGLVGWTEKGEEERERERGRRSARTKLGILE